MEIVLNRTQEQSACDFNALQCWYNSNVAQISARVCRVLSDGRGASRHHCGPESGRVTRPCVTVMSKRGPLGPLNVSDRSRWALVVGADSWHSIRLHWECDSAGNMQSQVYRSLPTSRQKNNSAKLIETFHTSYQTQGDVLEEGKLIIFSWEQIYTL